MTTVADVVAKMRETGGVGNGFQVVTPSEFNRETGVRFGLDEDAAWAVKTITVTKVKDLEAAGDLHGVVDERGRVRLTLAPEGSDLHIGVISARGADVAARQKHALGVLRAAAGKGVRLSDKR